MTSKQRIDEVNSILLQDYKTHNYNQEWIGKNIPLPIKGNKYESLRQDAPFYCISSMSVMLNHYESKGNFRKYIDDVSGKLLNTDFPDVDLNTILKWVLAQTADCIAHENSDKEDSQNVGWWMGQAVYVACVVSNKYQAQYERIFLEAWKMYFTNETLDN